MNTSKKNKIILLGFSGGGKTTVGRLLSERLDIPDYDTDAMISAREGRSISDLFASCGEPYFRDLETALLEELAGAGEKAVVAIGGGMPVRERNRVLLKQMGTVFYLKASVDTLERRLQGDTTRPLLKSGNVRERIEQLLSAREDIYLSLADHVIMTDAQTPGQTAEEICRLCCRAGESRTTR